MYGHVRSEVISISEDSGIFQGDTGKGQSVGSGGGVSVGDMKIFLKSIGNVLSR